MSAVKKFDGDRFLVVVADEALAIIYGRETRRAPLQERHRLENHVARRKGVELVSDRGGRAFDSFGAGRHAMGKELHGPKRQSSEAFARQVAECIELYRQSGNCIAYTVVAAPRFLGMLRQALARTSCPAPATTIDKDVTGCDTDFIQQLVDRG